MCLVQECVKILVFVFNFVFVLVGAALITIGTLYKLNFEDVTKFIPTSHAHFDLMPVFTIVVGCVIFTIAFFGCCGALRSSNCLLTTYAVILLVIFLIQIALGVFAFLEIKDREELKKNVNSTVNTIFVNKLELNTTQFIQQELKCCGTYGPDFWQKEMSQSVPDSCREDNKASGKLFTGGCQGAVYGFLVNAATIIGICALALSATEVLGAIMSLCLANSVRNEARRGTYY